MPIALGSTGGYEGFWVLLQKGVDGRPLSRLRLSESLAHTTFLPELQSTYMSRDAMPISSLEG